MLLVGEFSAPNKNIDIKSEDATFLLDVWVQMVWEDQSFEGVNVFSEEGLNRFKREEPEVPHSPASHVHPRVLRSL